MHARMVFQPTVHDSGTMGCQTIPNQNNRSLEMTRELTQDVFDLWSEFFRDLSAWLASSIPTLINPGILILSNNWGEALNGR